MNGCVNSHLLCLGEDATSKELLAYLAERLVHYKIPQSFEYVSEPLRDDGRVRRSGLREQRIAATATASDTPGQA